MNNDYISREALKKCARVVFDKDLGRLRVVDVSDIDNAPTVTIPNYDERPQGECENCKYFKESLCEKSPNGWCSIRRVTQEGDLETQVPKDYYCSWFEKGGAE